MTGVPQQTESQFQDAVIEYAQLTCWAVAHFRGVRVQRADGSHYYATPVQADGEGFPDLVLVRERVIYAELKSDRGRLSDDQTIWKDRLRGAGAEFYVWRPRDWPSIERILAIGSRRP